MAHFLSIFQVNDDGEVKVDKRTIGTGEENEDAIKPRGTDAPKATSDEGTETVLYTNSLKVREIMHGNIISLVLRTMI